ncbi:tRNA (adenosine(37)-N6)-threonylcarbamoyltransferase complex dimerization subunit type 1 TsaB [Comamonadaceae bacterium SL12-8]|uniref:tRNA (Adenosine(37)-N6)-threonylcarbamoyltransferase complex dimerization subunit type 1 TsaB n=2 Tax=Amphibiibacter pelophylacis TaxID=1799477 RepID=A0ACC6P029_9BURK
MTLILALDASSDVLAVALSAADDHGHAVWAWQGPGAAQASSQALPALQALLHAAGRTLADVDAIAFGQGPGAFTGLRLACSVAQGLAFGLGKPVLPLSSLALVAQAAWLALTATESRQPEDLARTPLQVAIDARMDEIYGARVQAVLDAQGRVTQWQHPGSGRIQPTLMSTTAWGDALPQTDPDHPGLILGNAPQRLAAQIVPAELAQRGWHAADLTLDAIREAGSSAAGIVPLTLRLDTRDRLLDAPGGPLPWRALGLATLAQQQWRQAHNHADAAAAGLLVPPEAALPLYVRDQVAQTTAERDAARLARQQDQAKAQMQAAPPAAPTPVLRALTLNDLDAVLAVQQQAYSARGWTPPWSRGQLATSLAAGETLLGEFAGDAKGAPLCGWLAGQVAADSAELQGLAVTPDAQRTGVAMRLVAAWKDAARQRGAREMFLEVRASNDAALALYRAAGFTDCGLRKTYYSQPVEDARVLRCGLTGSAGDAS